MDGRTVLITGATDGLGRALAADLAGRGARVLVHGRDPERVSAAVAETGAATGYVADLASLAEVRRLADEVARDHAALHVLVSNAGIGTTLPGRGGGGPPGPRMGPPAPPPHFTCSSATPASAGRCPARANAWRAPPATSCASRSTTSPASC